MTSKVINKTKIEIDPNLPTIRSIREFDAPPDRVYLAHTDPELVARWMGPREEPIKIDHWDARTGGSFRYSPRNAQPGDPGFFGSFHELRENERIVETYAYDGYPDGVSLAITTLTAIEGGRTRLESLTVLDSLESRDGLVARGMEQGMVEAYDQLEELLANG